MKFLNLCLVLSLLYGQVSFSMPDDLHRKDSMLTDSVSSEARSLGSEQELIPSSFISDNAEMMVETGSEATSEVTVETTLENVSVLAKTPYEDSNMTEWMAQRGMSINRMNSMRWKPIHAAALHGDADLVEWLVNHGEDVNSLAKEGRTPLMMASERGYLKIVELLIKNGANVDVCADDGFTSLMIAAFNGRFGVVKYLVDSGADMNAHAKDGSTALQLAASHRHWEIVDFLKRRTGNRREIISPLGISLPVAE